MLWRSLSSLLAAILASVCVAAAAEIEELPLDRVSERFTGDLEGMHERRLIRVAVPYNHTHFFVEAGIHRGIEYESFELFEEQLNARRGKGAARVNVVYVPLARGELLQAVLDGRADVAAGGITVTHERQQHVAFTRPTLRRVREVLVTAPDTPVPTSTEALSGLSVFVRPTSSYAESLRALNERLHATGLAPVDIEPAPEVLEDEDILEMVNAALVPATVVDSYLAALWQEVLPRLVVHEEVSVREGAEIAWAVRRDSVRLLAVLDDFLSRHGAGSTTGNVLIRRYAGNASLLRRALSGAEGKRFDAMAPLFREYGSLYQLDWLLLTAQAFQESRLDQSARSRAGAVGVMQLLPTTGRAMGVGDIRKLDANVHAGTKYLRSVIDRYFADEEIGRQDRMLFAFAAYNMGPARMQQVRRDARANGADANVWFDHVERSAERRVGREPVRYVSNIYKYYVSYRLLEEHRGERGRAKEQLRSSR